MHSKLKKKFSSTTPQGSSSTTSLQPGAGRDIPQMFSTLSNKSWSKVQNNFPTWPRNAKSPVPDFLNEADIASIIGDIIFQAGVDYETRPMVVLFACAFPDPKFVSYDEILRRILLYLDAFVESDYTVMLFAAGAQHQPSWSWIWKAYRSLSRKYRKNLKQLYVVHSSWFSRMLFSLAGSTISPKFFRKITYVSTLTELATHVPLAQIALTPEVYQENLKHETQITMPRQRTSNVFGAPLEVVMKNERGEVETPLVVRDCLKYLKQHGLQSEGLFRRSPSSTRLKQVADAYDRGQAVSLESYRDPNIAAVLVKKFFRDLPTPIFPESSYPTIRRCPIYFSEAESEATVEYIRNEILPTIAPQVGLTLLRDVLEFMMEVAHHASSNRMDAHNLALVLAPNLLSGTNTTQDVQMCLMPIDERNHSDTSSSSSNRTREATLGYIIYICIDQFDRVFSTRSSGD